MISNQVQVKVISDGGYGPFCDNCHAHSFILYILCFISYFLLILFYAYFPCVVFFNICTVHGADQTHISLLVIQSLCSRVCDK